MGIPARSAAEKGERRRKDVCKDQQPGRICVEWLQCERGGGYQRRTASIHHRGPAGQRCARGHGPRAQRAEKPVLRLARQPDHRQSRSRRYPQDRPCVRPACSSCHSGCLRAAARPRPGGRLHRRAFAGRRRAQCDGRAAHGAGRGAAGRAPPVRSRRKRGRGRGSRRALRLPCPYGAGRSAPFDGRSAHRTGTARGLCTRRAPGRTGLCRCPGPAGGPARHGDRRRRRPQYFIDRRAGHGKIHAGQTSAGHSAAALPHGGCGDDEGIFCGGHAAPRQRACEPPPVPRAASFGKCGGPCGRRQHAASRRGKPRTQRRPVFG